MSSLREKRRLRLAITTTALSIRVSYAALFTRRRTRVTACCLSCFITKGNLAYYEIRRKTKNLTVTVVRDNGAQDSFQNSQPCIYCQEMLIKLGFKKIIYSTDNGEIEIKRPKDLNSKHFSRAQRVTMDTVSH